MPRRIFCAIHAGRDLNCLGWHSVAPLEPKRVKLTHLDPRVTADDGLAIPLQSLVDIRGFQHPQSADVLLGLQMARR